MSSLVGSLSVKAHAAGVQQRHLGGPCLPGCLPQAELHRGRAARRPQGRDALEGLLSSRVIALQRQKGFLQRQTGLIDAFGCCVLPALIHLWSQHSG